MASSDLRDAERLGSTLGVLVRYGAPQVRLAIAALRDGEATKAQQKIAADFIDAVAH